jgi:hypothetical protein
MKEALTSLETSVLTRATPRNIPEDAILHNLSSLQPSLFASVLPNLQTNKTAFEVFTTVTMKNALFWDVALIRTNVSG